MSLIPVRKRYIIFGAGNAGKLVAGQPLPFDYCVDNDVGKHQGSLMGLPIKPPAALLDEPKGECFVIIANYANSEAISRQLKGMGFISDEDFADFRECGLEGAMPSIRQLRINVTRKCNSHCLMCNVWQEKSPAEFTPAEMGKMLNDPFFRDVQDAYITGGEPTALADFSAYVKAAVDALPSLRYVSTVVNGLLPEKTVSMMQKCKNVLRNSDIDFWVAVSLDGLEKENDAQRGVPGSFAKAMRTINSLREAGFPVTVSTTITKINLHGMDRFLDFLQEEQLPCNFKLGIQAAFFNNRESSSIFDYTDEELYLLKRFFLRVADVYKNNSFARTVAINQFYMLEGSERLLSCPYLECTAATLTETGQLKYCCSKSKPLGSVFDAPAAVLFQHNRGYLSFLGHTNCLECNADAFSGQSPRMIALLEAEAYWNGFYSRQEWLSTMTDHELVGDVNHFGQDTVLLVGFFGSETEDDARLLNALVCQCEKKYPNQRFLIASFLPFITRHMLKQAVSNIQVEVIPTHDKRFLSACYFTSHIVAVTPKEPYYPWVKCAEHIAAKTGKTVTYFSLEKDARRKEVPDCES
jgi:MoaA/NifB/PqqE/SkfB family radical SAM enzyme